MEHPRLLLQQGSHRPAGMYVFARSGFSELLLRSALAGVFRLFYPWLSASQSRPASATLRKPNACLHTHSRPPTSSNLNPPRHQPQQRRPGRCSCHCSSHHVKIPSHQHLLWLPISVNRSRSTQGNISSPSATTQLRAAPSN
jgi:hypothetical protein